MSQTLHTHIDYFITLCYQLSVICHPERKAEILNVILPQLKKFIPISELPVVSHFLSTFNDLLSGYISEEKIICKQDKRIRKAREYIREKYSDPIKLMDVARHAGLSASALSRLFRKQTGKTFIDYLNDIRIEQSENQLRQTGDLLSEIAYSCGFGSARHFAMVFKCKKGMSPGLFRRNL